jgi:hypothetical protein
MAMKPDEPCGPGNPFARGPKDSRYVENIIEHAFLSEVLQHCWFIRKHYVEVIRPEVDGAGYDVVLEANNRIRHIQLRAIAAGGAGRPRKPILARLRDHPDPCVIRISWSVNPKTCRIVLRYRYSGRANWPPQGKEEKGFELKGAHFVPRTPDFLDTPALVNQLFGPADSDRRA